MAIKSKNKWIIIFDSSIFEDDNGLKREVIYMDDLKNRFKITILIGHYEDRSYASLEKWTTENGFREIINRKPQRDYGIRITKHNDYALSAFNPIVDHLMKISESF